MSLWLELEQAGIGDSRPLAEVLDAMPWNADGLITAITQHNDSNEVLMRPGQTAALGKKA